MLCLFLINFIEDLEIYGLVIDLASGIIVTVQPGELGKDEIGTRAKFWLVPLYKNTNSPGRAADPGSGLYSEGL